MKKQKILLIDDDHSFLWLTGKKLEKVSYLENVHCSLTVKEAREFLDSCLEGYHPTPDVIFVDIYMPGIGGLDFADLYSRKYAQLFPNTKLVVLTTSISRKEREIAMEIPAVDDFIQKPLTEEKLSRVFLD